MALLAALSTDAVSAPTTPDTRRPREWLVVWAGDQNVSDTSSGTIPDAPLRVLVGPPAQPAGDAVPGRDFLAMIDANRNPPTYGK
ncbi:hypothetical protein HC028_15730 [Planosporangium flavigriseum]|uniref:Uncharacterized protein n=1 Tax=Planosporangium flavigriseum TaxID=373681 RepID=A0A8J3M2N6_9ACTN|nr:hypothetical protein [Planosporangium flavigriseum]NJC65940.1 hypothetical protein [Planosporangium flavigriseum]GIG75645.1 hypothetical protein Pfl04_40490 [Planosporangium flavigriseum]